jgi:hypothetical protein
MYPIIDRYWAPGLTASHRSVDLTVFEEADMASLGEFDPMSCKGLNTSSILLPCEIASLEADTPFEPCLSPSPLSSLVLAPWSPTEVCCSPTRESPPIAMNANPGVYSWYHPDDWVAAEDSHKSCSPTRESPPIAMNANPGAYSWYHPDDWVAAEDSHLRNDLLRNPCGLEPIPMALTQATRQTPEIPEEVYTNGGQSFAPTARHIKGLSSNTASVASKAVSISSNAFNVGSDSYKPPSVPRYIKGLSSNTASVASKAVSVSSNAFNVGSDSYQPPFKTVITKDGRFPCAHCGVLYKYPRALRTHLRRFH